MTETSLHTRIRNNKTTDKETAMQTMQMLKVKAHQKSNYPKKRIYTTDDKREYKPRNNKGEYKKDDQQSGEKRSMSRKKIDETKQPQYNKRRGNVEGNYKKQSTGCKQ